MQIDFYILHTATTRHDARAYFACHLIHKAYRHKHHIYIHSNDQEHAQSLDDLLWMVPENAFMPHGLCDEKAPLPIQIGYQQPPEQYNDILLNLALQVPECYSQFQRVIEIVPPQQAAEERNAIREHYRFYQEHGITLKTHDIHRMPRE